MDWSVSNGYLNSWFKNPSRYHIDFMGDLIVALFEIKTGKRLVIDDFSGTHSGDYHVKTHT